MYATAKALRSNMEDSKYISNRKGGAFCNCDKMRRIFARIFGLCSVFKKMTPHL